MGRGLGWLGVAALVGWLGGAASAQLPAPPTLGPELGPALPRHPLPRFDLSGDGAERLGCPVTLVEGLGVVAARHCGAHAGRSVIRFGNERRRVIDVVVPTTAVEDANGRFARPQHDWALLALERPLPAADRFAYLGRAGLVGAGRDMPLLKLGPGPRPTDPPEIGRCWPLEATVGGEVFTFRCTGGTGPGRSGSPLLQRTAEGWAFVGMHVAEFKGPDGSTIGIAIVPPPP